MSTYHGKIDALVILERVQQPDKPLALGIRENVTLCQDMADLVQLEQ